MKKLKYFFDYYTLHVVVGLICVLTVGYFAKTILLDRKDVILSVMYLQGDTEVDTEQMERELKEYLELKGEKQDITFSFLEPDVSQNQAIILTRLRAKSVDIVIAERDVFEQYASAGMFVPLDLVLEKDFIEKNRTVLIEGSIVTLDAAGNVAETGEKKAYGLDLLENKKYESFGNFMDSPILGIAANSMHMENAERAVLFFFEKE